MLWFKSWKWSHLEVEVFRLRAFCNVFSPSFLQNFSGHFPPFIRIFLKDLQISAWSSSSLLLESHGYTTSFLKDVHEHSLDISCALPGLLWISAFFGRFMKILRAIAVWPLDSLPVLYELSPVSIWVFPKLFPFFHHTSKNYWFTSTSFPGWKRSVV